MAPKKKKHSNDLRTLVINHYLNGDSQREIAKKVLLSRPTVQLIIKKYKNTKCIGNLFGRRRRPKTTSMTDRLIQRKLKLDRRKSARTVTSELGKDWDTIVWSDESKFNLFGSDGRTMVWRNRDEQFVLCQQSTMKVLL